MQIFFVINLFFNKRLKIIILNLLIYNSQRRSAGFQVKFFGSILALLFECFV